MSVPFDPTSKSILVPVRVVGPRDIGTLQCAVDTGAAITVLSAPILRRLGYDLSRPVGRARLRGVAGSEHAPTIRVSAITALARVRTDLVVAAHTFPLGTKADGLLGLDFFRGLILTLDFDRGRVSLNHRTWWRFW